MIAVIITIIFMAKEAPVGVEDRELLTLPLQVLTSSGYVLYASCCTRC
jgi:hypothetical protein